jgi:hypothetical protein
MESTGGTADKDHDYFPLRETASRDHFPDAPGPALNQRFIRRSSK